MGKLFTLILILLMIWAGVEVYTKGVDGALEGIFASESERPTYDSTPERAGRAVERAFDQSEQRVNRLLGE